MLINFQIPGSTDLKVKKPVPGKGIQHVAHKTYWVFQFCIPVSVNIQPDKNIRFFGTS
jgi:hypothetical protein